jgi:competence protein ComEA
MGRGRRLLWISAFAGIAYLIWRWRNQQATIVDPYTPPPAPSGPFPSAELVCSPLGSIASAPAPVAPPEPEPTAPPAVALRELAIGASIPPLEARPPEIKPEVRPVAQPEAEPLEGEAESAEPATYDNGQAIAPAGLVNINTADLAALIALPGIGPALARRIISYRTSAGPFASVEQLIAIQGIGPRNIDEFRHLLTV